MRTAAQCYPICLADFLPSYFTPFSALLRTHYLQTNTPPPMTSLNFYPLPLVDWMETDNIICSGMTLCLTTYVFCSTFMYVDAEFNGQVYTNYILNI